MHSEMGATRLPGSGVGARRIVPPTQQVKEKKGKEGNLKLLTNEQKALFSMTTITQIEQAMQTLLTTTANAVAKKQALSSGSGS